ncbi:MAG: (d)CMP kinase [Porphyromonadaceae bacterium]|nr:(d)CMP kinase [Porphyromonadaceae bacterium]
MTKKIIVAIDGYSSCGKSSMARTLARAIDYIYVDTGAMYRGVTLFALRRGFIREGVIQEAELREALNEVSLSFRQSHEGTTPELYLNGENVEKEIRTMEVASFVSPIAALGFVREFLTAQQQAFGAEGGIVMDGRDIGTAVFPQAELKVFVTADPVIRAERRLAELRGKGDSKITLEEVLENLRQRDYIDTHREVAPLRQAEDARILDNSHLTHDEQDALLRSYFEEALAKA